MPLRIAFVTYDGPPTVEKAVNKHRGGLNTILFNIIKYLSLDNGNIIDVVYREDSSKIDDFLINTPNINLFPIEAGAASVVRKDVSNKELENFRDGLISYLTVHKPQVIHSAGSEAGIVCSKIKDSPTWVHTNFATLAVRRFFLEGVKKELLFNSVITRRELNCVRMCDHVVALSDQDRLEVSKVFGVALTKISTVYPGVDAEVFKPENSLGRGHLIVSAGRMSRVKDFPFLLRAFKLVLDKQNSELLIIGGDKDERRRLNLPEIIEELGVQKHVQFKDGMSHHELARFLRRGKVFVISSKHETFGLLPIEARACGTPTVIRQNSALEEVSSSSAGGYLTSNNSEESMAKALIKILGLEDKEWIELSRFAIESVHKYNWVRSTETLMNLYEKLILSK